MLLVFIRMSSPVSLSNLISQFIAAFNLSATQQLLACLVMNAVKVDSKWSLHLLTYR